MHELTCLLSPQVILAGLLRHTFVDTSWNNQSLLLKWILIERWRRPSMLSSLCQHVARLQFDGCAQKHSLCGPVMMAWIWHFWMNAMVFVPAAKAAPKAGAKELSYNSLNLACSGQHLVSDQTDLFSFATHGDEYGVLPWKQANLDIGHQIRPRLISPRAIFKWKNLIEQLKLLLKWMLIERWRRPSMLSSMRQHVTRLQFHSCAKKDSLCGTVMIYDGLNWKCLDQCHGVPPQGTSFSA